MRTFTRHSRSLAFAAALLVLLIAAGLRFHWLGAQSLWNDEGSAYVQATRSFAAIAENAARDIHPPLYYWMLAMWRGLVGESEFGLRSLSALASLLSVGFTIALGRRLYGMWAGMIAGALVALNTFSIYYAQEARMYAVLALFSVAAMWALVGFTQAQSRRAQMRWGAALALLNAAGLWTQYVYPSVMLAQGALMLLWLAWHIRERQAWRDALVIYIIANLITIALFLPWLPAAWTQITTWPNTGDETPIGEAIAQLMGWLTVGISYPYSGTGVPVLMILVFALMLIPRERDGLTWWRLLVPVLWTLIMVGLFLSMGLFRDANLKFLLPAQIAYALWLARGLWALWHIVSRRTGVIFRAAPRLAAIAGGAVLMVALIGAVPPLYTVADYQRDNYRAIVQAIEADPRPDKAVILNAPGQSEVFEYYARGRFDTHLLPIGMTVEEAPTRAEIARVLAANSRIYAVMWGTDERDPAGVVEDALNAGAFPIDDRWFGSVRLVRYVTPLQGGESVRVGARFGDSITLESYTLSSDSAAVGDALQLRLEWSTDAPLDRRYKVFVQLLNPDGTLAAQRDSEPAANRQPTSTWRVGETVSDNHALLIPDTLVPSAGYSLIIGLYDADNPAARLPVKNGDFLEIGAITITE